MTTVTRITLPDGTRFLSLGDFDEEQIDTFMNSSKGILNESELECDIVTVAHHGYNKVEAVYKAAKATYALWPNHISDGYDQGFIGIGASWQYERAQDIIGWLKNAGASESNIYYAGVNTVKMTCANGTVTVTLSNPVY